MLLVVVTSTSVASPTTKLEAVACARIPRFELQPPAARLTSYTQTNNVYSKT